LPPRLPVALCGDGLAFWIGHRSQREILGTWPMANYPKLIEESEAFFNKWGTLAVFFARFVPPIRAFVPITAGSLGMAPWKFYSVNVCAVLLWAAAHVLPGVVAVSMLHQYAGLPHHEHVGKHMWMFAAAFGAVIVGAVIWTLRRRHGHGSVAKPAN
jgi:membrane protein DedA with SNARE-associated domain